MFSQFRNILHFWFASVLLSVLTILLLAAACSAREAVSSYDVLTKGTKDAKTYFMQSELSLRNEDVNRAIKKGRRAVDLDPDDLDARVALGEALYAKWKFEKKKTSPQLYNECVKTWLMVLRNVTGEEALSYKGISIPLAQHLWADEDRGILAKKRLTTMCGRVPKFWETNKKFLSKVLVPEVKETVAGTVISKQGIDSTSVKDIETQKDEMQDVSVWHAPSSVERP